VLRSGGCTGRRAVAATVAEGCVEQALVVKTAADSYAATAKAGGDPRRVGVLRMEGLARMCGNYLTGQTGPVGRAPRAGGLPVEIGVVIGIDTVLGRRDLPGEVPGHGIVPREVIARMVSDEAAKLRLLVIDEATGRLLHRAVDAYRPTPEQIAHIRAEYVHSVGPGSQVPAVRTDTDHVIEYPDGPTQIGNLIPDDRTWHNGHTRRQLSVAIDHTGAVFWTSVLGQSRSVTPYDYRVDPPADKRVDGATLEPPSAELPPF
jgi:hypothetical protein